MFSSGRLMALYDFNTFTKRDRLGAIEILSFISHLRGYGDEGKDIWGDKLWSVETLVYF